MCEHVGIYIYEDNYFRRVSNYFIRYFFNMDYYFPITLIVLGKLINKNATKNYNSEFLISHILKIAAFPIVGV